MGAAAGRAMAALHITCAARRIISVLPGGAWASPGVGDVGHRPDR